MFTRGCRLFVSIWVVSLLFAIPGAAQDRKTASKRIPGRGKGDCSSAASIDSPEDCIAEHQGRLKVHQERLDHIETQTIPQVTTNVGSRLSGQDDRLKNIEGSVNGLLKDINGVSFSIDRFWVLLAAVLVFFMQAGFKCLEVGMVQGRFDTVQASQKLFSWIMTFVGYFPLGFGLMFGVTHLGWIGNGPFGPEKLVDDANILIGGVMTVLKGVPGPEVRGLEFFLFQAAFAATAVTIPAGATAERMSLKGYMWAALVIAAVVYPVFGHLAWGGSTYTDEVQMCTEQAPECAAKILKSPKMYTEQAVKAAAAVREDPTKAILPVHAPMQGWLQKRGFHDFAGSTVVHSVGGWFGLVGALFLGSRKGRFHADGTVNTKDFPSRSRGYAILGVFMLWFGWWGFNGGSQLTYDTNIAKIILKTNLAGAAAGLSAYLFAYVEEYLPWKWFQKGFAPEKTIGGVLGGLVAITASCDRATEFQSFFIIGLSAGIVHNLVFDLLLWRKIDDAVGAFPVHTGCGILGTLLVSLTYPENIGGQFNIQLRGVLIAFAWTVSAAAVFFGLWRLLSGVRWIGPLFQLDPPEAEWVSGGEEKVRA